MLRDDIPTPEEALTWIQKTRDLIAAAAERRELSPRDFAATLVFAVTDGLKSLFVHVGDGGMAIRDEESGSWICPTWPNQGEYASTTFFVTDDTFPPVRICLIQNTISALAVFSDGIERLALNFAEEKAHEPFFDAMISPLDSAKVDGKIRDLCESLSQFLDSDRVNDRTDDDKTLVLATRK